MKKFLRQLKKFPVFFSIIATVVILNGFDSASAERLKDVSVFAGIRENELIGYGLVIGLNGTGDKDGTYVFQPFANMLTSMGITVNPNDIKGKTKNIAAVIVTAKLPTMTKPGTRVDVQVSSIGDAKSLQGGTLLMTPLKGLDGNVYAVAQGALSIGGVPSGGGQASRTHPNVAMVPGGALVEREVPVRLNDKNKLDLMLMVQDISTAKHVADRINAQLGGGFAKAESPSSISIMVPPNYTNRVVDLMSVIEQIDVKIDVPARVVINERTGTIVIGENVSIAPIALSHGLLSITVKNEIKPPVAPANTPQANAPAQPIIEEKKEMLVPVKGATVGELLKALNAIGATPKDMVAILQAIKASGALKADLVIM